MERARSCSRSLAASPSAIAHDYLSCPWQHRSSRLNEKSRLPPLLISPLTDSTTVFDEIPVQNVVFPTLSIPPPPLNLDFQTDLELCPEEILTCTRDGLPLHALISYFCDCVSTIMILALGNSILFMLPEIVS